MSCKARFNYMGCGIRSDGTLCSKIDLGFVDKLVVLHPLEENPVNIAASSFRINEIAVVFSVVERELREALNEEDISRLPGNPLTILNYVVFDDPSINIWRSRCDEVLLHTMNSKETKRESRKRQKTKEKENQKSR